jgi:DNA-binding CsgD family transcriptional regulator
MWDDDSSDVVATRHLKIAREVGALTELPLALTARIYVDAFAGDLVTASLLVEQLKVVSEAMGGFVLPQGALIVAAWRGREAEASTLFEATIKEGRARGETLSLGAAHWTSAILYNGLGRYEDALANAERATEHPEDMGFFQWPKVELIEAAVRSGQPERARDVCQSLSDNTRASGTDWALGIEARSQALVSDGGSADRLYRDAIERLGRTRVRGELARAHLLYGEWLRRERRRVDAREQLHAAHAMLDGMGAEAFAERARRELLATGETVRKRTVETRDELTDQERQIAHLARDGLSNPEIAGRLFISPRTVQYHLGKVFVKLDITSRNQLGQVLPREPVAALAS